MGAHMDDDDSGLRTSSSPKPEDLSIGSNEIRVKSELDFQSGLDGSDMMEQNNGDNPMSCLAIVHDDETIEGSSSSAAMLARLNAGIDHHQDQDVDVDVVGDDQDEEDIDGQGMGHPDDDDDEDMKMNISGMESDGGGSSRSQGDEHRRRLFRSAHLAATPQNYTGGSRRDKNGNVSGRLSREGRMKRPFNLAGGASATLNNNNLSNNNNHEKSPPLPPKRTRSVTNALATQGSHSNHSSPGSVDSKDKSSGSPNSSVSCLYFILTGGIVKTNFTFYFVKGGYKNY
jgi:hypothetical protein